MEHTLRIGVSKEPASGGIVSCRHAAAWHPGASAASQSYASTDTLVNERIDSRFRYTSAPRSGIPTASTSGRYGSATPSSRVRADAPRPIYTSRG